MYKIFLSDIVFLLLWKLASFYNLDFLKPHFKVKKKHIKKAKNFVYLDNLFKSNPKEAILKFNETNLSPYFKKRLLIKNFYTIYKLNPYFLSKHENLLPKPYKLFLNKKYNELVRLYPTHTLSKILIKNKKIKNKKILAYFYFKTRKYTKTIKLCRKYGINELFYLISLYRTGKYKEFEKIFKKVKGNKKYVYKLFILAKTGKDKEFEKLALNLLKDKKFKYKEIVIRELILYKKGYLIKKTNLRNLHGKSAYLSGLYFLNQGDTINALYLFRKVFKNSKSIELKTKTAFWLFTLTKENEYKIYISTKNPLSIYSLILNGLPKDTSSKIEEYFVKNNIETFLDTEKYETFRYLLYYDPYESYLFARKEMNTFTLYKASLWAFATGYYWISVKLSIEIYKKLKKKGIKEFHPVILYLMFPLLYLTEITYFEDVNLILAIMHAESHFNPKAVSSAGAKGLMQVMPFHNKTNKSLFEIEYNIKLGINIFKNYLDSLKGDTLWAIASYNAGLKAVKEWKQDVEIRNKLAVIDFIPYKETRKYVERVLRNKIIYEKLYNLRILQ